MTINIILVFIVVVAIYIYLDSKEVLLIKY